MIELGRIEADRMIQFNSSLVFEGRVDEIIVPVTLKAGLGSPDNSGHQIILYNYVYAP